MGPINVSVCIPTYNRKTKVCDAIDSVLQQSCLPSEIIVVDNCSTDGTFAYLQKRYGDAIRLFQNKTNIGPVGNWINCLGKVNSDYVKFLFSDDVLHEDYLQIATGHLDIGGKSVFFAFSTEDELKVKGSLRVLEQSSSRFLHNLLIHNKYPISPSMYVLPKNLVLEALTMTHKTIDGFGGFDSGAGYDLYSIIHSAAHVQRICYIETELIRVGASADSISISQASLSLSCSYIAAKYKFINKSIASSFIYTPWLWFQYNRYFEKINLIGFIRKFSE